jgi:hypothetical protein
MNHIFWGLVFRLVFGTLDVVVMIPLKYENNRKRTEAMSAAFLERFMIGFLIPNVTISSIPVVNGLIIGFGLSIPSAIITRAYIPIIGIGTAGGLIIGIFTSLII